jgi:hypothetical protein
MKFPSIRIEGSIFSSDILEKIEQGDIGGQLAKDFGFDSNIKVKDEIAVAWADANSLWKILKGRTENLKEGESGTSETRKYWIIPFLGLLGYDIENYRSAQEISGKNYAISHYASNKDKFPVHIMGVNDSLDRKRESGGPRMSPHSLLQEYINLTEHLYAIVSNGLTLRLLRDSSRLVKLSYIEFDLEKMFEEDQFTDFAVLFRLLHASRMPVTKETAADSLVEKYHLDALESGDRIRSGLSLAVENSIRQFGTGFLNNPENKKLIEAIESDKANTGLLHINLLRLIYRILFLLVIEERNLVYPDRYDKNLRDIFYNYYSVSSLRKISELKYLSNKKFNNLWIQLKNTFLLFENEHSGKALGLKPLSGDLFGESAIELIKDCDLENKYLLECLNNLNFYRNEKGQQFRVNYSALSVEEFGSVYEGLLEYKPAIHKSNGKYEYALEKGSERSMSGSHYTPDELVQPLIKHSLDYIIEDKLKEKDKEKALLSITVCDVACGSGHILLNAARRIAIELAKVRSGEDQPNPTEYRKALKDVIKNCIYGVDKNPLAVELCKVALWLESHNPGEPLNFLDHKIKCGDSIVGLAHKEELEKGIPTEAFKTLPGDDKNVASEFRKKNNSEIQRRKKKQIALKFQEKVDKEIKNISGQINEISSLPESTPEEVEIKKAKYLELNSDNDWWKLKVLSDIQVAQFFIAKTFENKNNIITDSDYFEYLYNERQLVGQKVGEAMGVAQKNKFFHWFLEFPEVLNEGGFDCIIGNPPFLGGSKISGFYSDNYLNYLLFNYIDTTGRCDLVGFFVRRNFSILKIEHSVVSIISTNTISQGDTKKSSLDYILNNSGEINFAIKSIKWPGKAAVEVSLLSITKGVCKEKKFISNREVLSINSFLEEGNNNSATLYLLNQNESLSFEGIKLMGTGFILEEKLAKELIKKDSKNLDILFPYLNGDDLNSTVTQNASRWVINFFEWSEQEARKYPEAYKIVESLVKPVRLLQNDKKAKKLWWIYQRTRPELIKALKGLDKTIVVAKTSKSLAFELVSTKQVLNANLSIITLSNFQHFSILQSSIHFHWAWKYCTTMKTDLIYTPTTIFQPFPFPQNLSSKIEQQLETLGEFYHEHRKQLMLEIQLGLTKTYNQFHNKHLSSFKEDYSDSIDDLQIKEIEKKFGKETKNLINHFKKGEPNISLFKAIEGIEKLRQLHVEMDNAVLEAYGWQDIELRHDFYEVDYLPENDRVRFTIHPDARREILKRLLELNHKIHEEEVAAGLWDKKKTKSKKKLNVVGEPEVGLFDGVKENENV